MALSIFLHGDIVRTTNGRSEWIILTKIDGSVRSERFLCLCVRPDDVIICRFLGQSLIKLNCGLQTKKQIYSTINELPSYSGKWAEYLRQNPIPDKLFKLKIFKPYETFKIEKVHSNGTISYANCNVSNTDWRTIDKDLKNRFPMIFAEEPEVIEIKFAGIICESGMCSVWIDKFTIRSWAQKRGESLNCFDSNGWI